MVFRCPYLEGICVRALLIGIVAGEDLESGFHRVGTVTRYFVPNGRGNFFIVCVKEVCVGLRWVLGYSANLYIFFSFGFGGYGTLIGGELVISVGASIMRAQCDEIAFAVPTRVGV